jgi:hemoglobin
MKTDISLRKDLKLLLSKFYEHLLADEKMMPFFQEMLAENQLEPHLEIITDFWNDIIFDSILYQRNVMQKHLHKNTFVAFKKEHFTRWISYFNATIDAHFMGVNSERMKARAQSIATVMQLKMKLFQP